MTEQEVSDLRSAMITVRAANRAWDKASAAKRKACDEFDTATQELALTKIRLSAEIAKHTTP